MAQLDIAERRLPQDGRIKLKLGKGKRDGLPRLACCRRCSARRSSCASSTRANLQLDMTKLGFEQKPLDDFKKAIHQPYGMVLVTGPTGSGKTTTLYSALAELNKIDATTSSPPRIRSSTTCRHQPGADARRHRPQLRRRAARLPAPGPGHHHGRRDPRLRDRRDRGQGGAHRPPGALDAAHQRRARRRSRACSTWASSRSSSRRRVQPGPGAAPRAQDLRRLQAADRDRRRGAASTSASTTSRSRSGQAAARAPAAATCNGTGYKGRIALYEVMPFTRAAQGDGAAGRVDGRAQGGGDPAAACSTLRMAASARSSTASPRSKRSCASRWPTEPCHARNASRRPTRQPAAAAEGDGREGRVATCTSPTGSPPQLRIDGELVTAQASPPLTPIDTKQLCYSVLTEEQKTRFEEDSELDFSFGVKDLARFRANIFMQRGAVGRRLPHIPFKIRTFDELGLPPVVAGAVPTSRAAWCWSPGPTGSGKSTTLAAMIDKINTERPRAHHHHRGSDRVPAPAQELRRQPARGRRRHASRSRTRSSTILRQDPDVVLVGEMRDLETIEAALTIAETGHLVLRHAAHQPARADHQPHHRRLPAAPAAADPRAAVVRARGRRLADAAAASASAPGRVLALEVMIPNAGHPEPHPRGQDPPDLLADAGRPGRSTACRR